uniref:Globin n=1 Tax=Aceria tosichella TaxID=561515 RepID=A0A6G1SAM9_9ACAR
MALSEADVELIRASWIRARSDSIGAGVLLFKGLFTKFPDYLRLFNQFEDLDLDRIQENKRLVKHAVKVIETVTFVVDSIGDPTKHDQLNEALVGLVRGHQKRRIGLEEFQNLGIVLIDFICDLNNRRYNADGHQTNPNCRLISSSGIAPAGPPVTRGCNSSTSSSQDSGTMTSTLDKIRASLSPSSSSEDDSVLSRTLTSEITDEPIISGGLSMENHHHHNPHEADKYHEDHNANACDPDGQRLVHDSRRHSMKLDTSQLVIAWKKLYKIILDLVKSEESSASRE